MLKTVKCKHFEVCLTQMMVTDESKEDLWFRVLYFFCLKLEFHLL